MDQTGMAESPKSLDSKLTSVAMVVVVCTAFSSQMALPLWVGAIIDEYAFTPERAGIIAAFEYAAVAIVSVSIAVKVHRYDLRKISAIGMACLLLGNGVSGFMSEFYPLLTARGLAGFGKGLVIAAIFSLAARTESPTRKFALINGAYTALATVIYLTLPVPIGAFGAAGAFSALFAVTLLGALLLPWIPSARQAGSANVADSGSVFGSIPRSGFLLLIALILMWAANGSVWTYVERIGQSAGLSLQYVGTVLSTAAAIAVLGPVIAHRIHDRYGFRMPITIGALLMITAASVLCNWLHPIAYIVAAPLFVLATLFVVPYLMSLMSVADRAGRLAAAAGGLLTAGSSLGAYLGGVTLTYSNLLTLSVLAATLLLGVIFLVHLAVVMIDRQGRIAIEGASATQKIRT